jgi:hypothetical protein
MTIRTVAFGVGLSFLLNVTDGAQGKELPGATDALGGFGLPDQGGTRLLLIPYLARPELINTALCSDGRRVPVQFVRRQVEASNSGGRQTWHSLDKLAGSVFAVIGGTVDPDVPCFLASEALLAGAAVLTMAPPESPGACLQRGRFATLRDRQVVHCWPVARLVPDKQVVLLEFERRGKDALASLVVIDGSRTIFADLHAEFRGPGEDLWRADDEGVLSPQGFTIVCALQRGGWLALGTDWAAFEGRSLSLWISADNDRFTRVIGDYWYQAPR